MTPEQLAAIKRAEEKVSAESFTPEQQEAIARAKGEAIVPEVVEPQVTTLTPEQIQQTESIINPTGGMIPFALDQQSMVNPLVGGYKTAQSLGNKAAEYVAIKNPELAVDSPMLAAAIAVLDADFSTPEEKYGSGFSTLPEDQRREAVKTKRAQDVAAVMQQYPYDPNTGLAQVGSAVGSVASPESLLPLGQGYKAAAIGGAVLGGAYDFFDQSVDSESALDVGQMLQSAAFGAGTAVGVEGLIVKPLSKLLSSAKISDDLITADQITNTLAEIDGSLPTTISDTYDVKAIADQMNRAAGNIGDPAKKAKELDAYNKFDITSKPASVLEAEKNNLLANSFTKPDVVRVAKPKTGDATLTKEDLSNKIVSRQTRIDEYKDKLKTTKDGDRVARYKSYVKQYTQEIDDLKKQSATLDKPSAKTKYKTPTAKQKEEILSTQLDKKGFGYLSNDKMKSVEKELQQIVRSGRDRRASDRLAKERRQPTEPDQFSKTWQGPKRPIPSEAPKYYTATTVQENLIPSLGLDRAPTKIEATTKQISPELESRLTTEYGPRVEAAQKRLQEIKARRAMTAASMSENVSQSLTDSPSTIPGKQISNQVAKDVETFQWNQDIDTFMMSGVPETIIPVDPINPIFGPRKTGYAAAKAIKDRNIDPANPAAGIIAEPVGFMEKYSPKALINKFTNGVSNFSKPLHRIRTFGKNGEAAANMIEEAQVASRQILSSKVTDVIQKLHKLKIPVNSDEANLVAQVMRGIVKEKDVPANVAEAARFIRQNVYQYVSNDAVKTGKWTKEQFKEFTTKDWYLNRSYDQDYLRTTEGQEAFKKMLTDFEISNETTARKVLSSLTRDDAKTVDEMLSYLSKTQSGKYKIPRHIAEVIFKRMGKFQVASRSKFLDNERILPDEMESVLEPFMLKGLMPNIIAYLEDTIPSLEFAKKFGAKDEIATVLQKNILKETGSPQAGELFAQVYFDNIRDPRSHNLQSYYQASEFARNAIGSAKAFQTLKLIKAGVFNSTQGVVNGSTWLAGKSQVNAPKRLIGAYTNIFKTAKAMMSNAEMMDFVMRSGSVYDTTLLELAGQAHAGSHTILNRSLEGTILAPLDYLNNPSKFLRANGFQSVEKWNRVYATVLGRGYIEDLLAQKAKLMKRIELQPKQRVQLNQLNDALAEVGIDPTKEQVTLEDMLRGSQVISNEINFVNAPGHTPMFAKSLWGGLLFQFKDYITKQTNFISQNVIKPMQNGNFLPLVTYLGPAAGLGMTADQLSRLVMADDKEYSMTENWLRGLAVIGGLGIAQAVTTAVYRSPTGFTEWLAGPTVGDASRVLFGATRTAAEVAKSGVSQETTAPLQKAVIKSLGPAVNIVPYSREYLEELSDRKKAWWETQYD